MHRRFLSLLALVTGLLLSALAGPAGAAVPGVVTDLTWGISESDQQRTVDLVKAQSLGWVRLEVNWAELQPTGPDSYHAWKLAHVDRAVEVARAAGLRMVMTLDRAPAWASGSTNQGTPPKDPSTFASMAGYLAARYRGKIDAYEIWNEENISRFWSTGPNAAAYVSLLRPASAAVRAADPAAKIVFGGLSTNDDAFVKAAYAAGAKGLFDIMAVHPYTCANAPSVQRTDASGLTRDSFLGYRDVRAVMVANGDASPIWFTEMGWSTSSDACGVTPTQQAEYITSAFALAAADSYVQLALVYNLRNNYWARDADLLEAQYGLVDSAFNPKPGLAALRTIAQASAGTTLTEPVPQPAPAEPAPAGSSEPIPTQPAPSPSEPAPTEPAPTTTQPAPTEPAPTTTQPAPTTTQPKRRTKTRAVSSGRRSDTKRRSRNKARRGRIVLAR